MDTIKAVFIAINTIFILIFIAVLPYLIIPVITFFIAKEYYKENKEVVEEEEDFNPFHFTH